ncbi:2-amino-4-hydroxy-6-hydroxymethyldihydropteridine diphosphokinase [Wenzhouxiangella sp. AB-CW3]|uniref:2-amino-4-hydroxy-6- hydroxymethyldihydropteridine diphosphokinase n=1 Tax=Wenzhouxiangella sp. AB-CW3 TaxID=2771012 RepID=UPI00168B7289|nr:2-amino-4-hydroxy-6-hydroxymethyldihydropteridine diphosphokinase [Wenzhouxiangella sp. AB-CW3]QOC23278.1 2-amino-4-hydroxy-6-hydroxymethyldihydropteridine diphosphokinase [Wenzhouxiangella sp. AB-CW3]
MTRSWIGLGANLGQPEENLAAALERLHRSERVWVAEVSPAWWTPPWGVQDQPWYLNAVAALDTSLDARALLDLLLAVEAELGRRRDGQRWGARAIDLDLLLHGDHVIDETDLTVPHPRIPERAFVLVPLHAVAPTLTVPGHGRVDELLMALDDSDIRAMQPAGSLAFDPESRPLEDS